MDKEWFDESETPEAMATEQARQWVVFLASGEAAESDRQRFDRWLALSPLHRSAYSQVKQIWDGAGQLCGLANSTAASGSADQGKSGGSATLLPWTGARRKVSDNNTSLGSAVKKTVFAVSMAACLVLAVFVAQNLWSPESLQPLVYETAMGQTEDISLADGSTINLASGSRVEVTYTDQQRSVVLRSGEAMFDVQADPARVFQVAAAHMRVEVIGTRFNINAHRHAVVLRVAQGAVNVTDARRKDTNGKRQAIQVVAGNQLEMPQDRTRPLRVDRIEADAVGAWRRGMLVYDHTPLSQVLDDLCRNLGLKFNVLDPDLNSTPVTAAFQLQRGSEIVEILGEVSGADIVWQSSDQAVLKKKRDQR